MIITIVAVALLIWVWHRYILSWKSDTLSWVSLLIVLTWFFCGLLFPVLGFKAPVLIEETELVSLSNTQTVKGHGNLFYVSVSTDNAYSYRYEVKNTSDIEGTAYKLGLISGDVTEIETNTDKAVLKKYVIKPRRGIFVFALSGTKYKYEFVVPKGTIAKEIKLT